MSRPPSPFLGDPARSLTRGSGQVRAVALVLHGGRARSHQPVASYQLAVRRMTPFVHAIDKAAGPIGVAALAVRYRYRGWNADGSEPDPVIDGRWALGQVRERYGAVPVVLVGHSMGGRTALRLGGEPGVVGVAALAPWCEPGDPVDQLAHQDLLVVHGTRDRWTSPAAGLAMARSAQAAGASVRRLEMDGDSHGMLRRAHVWHQLVASYVLERVGDPSGGASATNPLANVHPGELTARV